MPKKPNPPSDDAEQAARFIETAKLLEADRQSQDFLKVVDSLLPTPTSAKKPKDQSST